MGCGKIGTTPAVNCSLDMAAVVVVTLPVDAVELDDDDDAPPPLGLFTSC